MSSELIGLLGIVIFLILIFLKIPIAYTMMFTGFVGFWLLVSFKASIRMISAELISTFSSYSLSVIPMFIWMGFIAFYSGVGSNLYSFAYKLIGHRRGGLAMASQIACAVFGAICGSNTAAAATMGAIALPEMRKYNYDDSLSSASIAAGGALGVLIPPSVIFIVYGIQTEQSIGKLFMAGIIPGIILMLLYIIAIYIQVTLKPHLGPAGTRFTWKERIAGLQNGLLEIIFTFAISLGGLFAGWFTPTEAGSVGTASILMITVLRKQIGIKGIKASLHATVKTTSMIMLLVSGAVIFGRFIAVSRIPFSLAGWATSLDIPSFAIIILILFIYLILGFVIDALALILLTIRSFILLLLEFLVMIRYGLEL